MGGKSKVAPQPQYTVNMQPLMAAAQASAATSEATSREQLDWARKVYDDDKARYDEEYKNYRGRQTDQDARIAGQDARVTAQDARLAEGDDRYKREDDRYTEMQKRLGGTIDDFLKRQDQLDMQSGSDRARYEKTFQPLEDQLVTDANGYTTQRNQVRGEQAAGRAAADVAQAYAGARSAAQDRLESFGVDPSQTRAQALDVGARVQEATARAQAVNAARAQTIRQEEATGRDLRGQAIQIGGNTANRSLQEAQLAGSQGAQAGQGISTGIQAGNANMASNRANVAAGIDNIAAGNMVVGEGNANLTRGIDFLDAGLRTTGMGANTMGTGVQWAGVGNQALATGVSAGKAQMDAESKAYENYLASKKLEQSSSSGWGQVAGLGLGLLGGKNTIGNIGTNLTGIGAGLATFGLAEGGAVPHDGVSVPDEASPTRGVILDDVPARLTPGEFVVPEDVVRWKGEEFFQRTIQAARKKRQEAPAKPNVQAIPMQAPVVNTTAALPVG